MIVARADWASHLLSVATVAAPIAFWAYYHWHCAGPLIFLPDR